MNNLFLCIGLVVLATGCAGDRRAQYEALPPGDIDHSVQSSDSRVAVITNLDGPEAVRYDEDLDAYFISNFGGSSREKDSNGYITKVNAVSGDVYHAFMTGSSFPLHAPRGMFITGDTLWVSDLEGVHAFDKRSGDQLSFVDLTQHEPGFLNDVATMGNGSIYVTDTGKRRVYHVSGSTSEIAIEDFGNPNGITYDGISERFLIAPWDAGDPILSWNPTDSLATFFLPNGSKIDGIEVHSERLIYAQQSDSTIQISNGSLIMPAIKTGGKPADIGLDTKRHQVAVPYIALDRVDIWQLPMH